LVNSEGVKVVQKIFIETKNGVDSIVAKGMM